MISGIKTGERRKDLDLSDIGRQVCLVLHGFEQLRFTLLLIRFLSLPVSERNNAL